MDKKREEKRSFMLYGFGAIFLYYTAYNMITGVLSGDEAVGENGTIFLICGILFALAATWLIYQCIKTYKKAKEREKEEALEEQRARGAGEETASGEEAPQGMLGGLFGAAAQQQAPSIAARAKFYQNPADEEEEEALEETVSTEEIKAE